MDARVFTAQRVTAFEVGARGRGDRRGGPERFATERRMQG